MSIDDFGPPGEVTAQPSTYNPNDDYASTRGLMGNREAGNESIATVGEMARILTLPAEQQAAAMLAWAKRPKDPNRRVMQEPDLRGVDGFGEF